MATAARPSCGTPVRITSAPRIPSCSATASFSRSSVGGLHRRQHAGLGVTGQIFEELLVGSCHGDLVIESQFCRGAERRQILHRGAEYLDVSRMRFRPPLQRSQALPPALTVGFFTRVPVGCEYAHVTVGVAADAEAVIAQEIHALAQYRFDVVEIELSL